MAQDRHDLERWKDRDLGRYRETRRSSSVAPDWMVRGESSQEDETGYGTNMVEDYLKTFLRQRWSITGCAVAGLVIAVLLQLSTQSVYQARTSIEVQAMNSDFMDARSVAPNAVLPSDAVLQTQVKLLASESLQDRVKAELKGQPHPTEVLQDSTFAHLGRLLHLDGGRRITYEELLNETAESVKIKPLGVSQLIEVTCESWDATFAARYCNTLTTEFQSADQESRGSQAKHISDWLVRQASDVRQKAEDAQQRLERAAGGNGLMLQSQTDTIGQERLRQMQTELVRAQADRMEKQAELAEAQSGSIDGVPDSAAYASSKARVADLEAQVAALVPPLTEANPKIIHLRAQIAESQANMAREKAITQNKLQENYQSAKHREDLLRMSYQNIEGSVSSDLQKSSEIEILRREVQSEQQLYQTLLQRAKEAGFASALPASNIRVVDEAHVPRMAVYPKRLTSAAIGCALGLAIGVVLGFLRERQAPRLRLPGEIGKFMRVDELGVIPSNTADTGRQRRLGPSKLAAIVSVSQQSDEEGAQQSETWREEALVAESYRSTTFSLLLNEPDSKSRIFVVSSPNAGEGKTTVTSNLGIALSKSRLRVVLVDGDLRKSRLHALLNVDNRLGLRDLLSEGVSTYEDRMHLVCKPTAYDNLSVIPSGGGDQSVSDLLHSPQLGILLRTLAEDFDVVLVDSPPMLHITDARIIAGKADSAILVFRSGETKLANAIAVRNMLQRDRVRIIGSVLNDFDPRREGQTRYYKGYYEYQNTQNRPNSGARAS